MYEELPTVMSVKDVSEILGVGRKTIYGEIKNKRLRSVKVGRQFLVPKHCLLEYLDGANYSASNSELNLTVIERS